MLTHVWGLMAHPHREWQAIRKEHESITHLYAHHVLLMALVPVICAYIGTTQFGWSLTDEYYILLEPLDAFFAGIAFYIAILTAIGIMGSVIHMLSQRFSGHPSRRRCIIFAGYVATPMFLAGLVALYPVIWVCVLAGTLGLCYSAYLLYLGIPPLLDISNKEGFLVTGSTLGIGVLVLEGLLAVTVLLWGYGARWFM